MAHKKTPRRIAFIMDGNRRWAQKNKLELVRGHRSGTDTFEKILKCVRSVADIEEVTIYTFSTENWSRPRTETDFLFGLLVEKIPKLIETACAEGIRVRFVGDLEDGRIPQKLKDAIGRVHKKTFSFTRLQINIAFNYGATLDVVHMAKTIARKVREDVCMAEQITEHLVQDNLLSREVSDIDLVIRTGGEVRTSNFLAYQTRYAEWIFLDVLWPDFTPEMFRECLTEYDRRERRFGGNNLKRILMLQD